MFSASYGPIEESGHPVHRRLWIFSEEHQPRHRRHLRYFYFPLLFYFRLDILQGFSFSGEVREPFPAVISALESTTIPVTSVDAPSSWDIEQGPPKSGPGAKFHPTALVSLTAPKPLVNFFRGRHFLGGR